MPQPKDPRKFSINDLSTDLEDFPGPKKRGAEVNVKIFTRLPSKDEVGEGEHVYSNVGGVFKMHVKLQGVLKSVTLT